MTTDSEGEYGVVIERNVVVVMRVGTVLRADIWRPDADGKFLVLFERTPSGLSLIHISEPMRPGMIAYAVVCSNAIYDVGL